MIELSKVWDKFVLKKVFYILIYINNISDNIQFFLSEAGMF